MGSQALHTSTTVAVLDTEIQIRESLLITIGNIFIK